MKLAISLLLLAAFGQATPTRADSLLVSPTIKRELLEANFGDRTGVLHRFGATVSPGIQYADDFKHDLEDQSTPHNQIFGAKLSQIPKISDLLTGHGPSFEVALANHLYSPVSVYNTKPTTSGLFQVTFPDKKESSNSKTSKKKNSSKGGNQKLANFSAKQPSFYQPEIYSYSPTLSSETTLEPFLPSGLRISEGSGITKSKLSHRKPFSGVSSHLYLQSEEKPSFRFPFKYSYQNPHLQYYQPQTVNEEYNYQDERQEVKEYHKKEGKLLKFETTKSPEFQDLPSIPKPAYHSHPNGAVSYASFTNNQEPSNEQPKYQLQYEQTSNAPHQPYAQQHHQQPIYVPEFVYTSEQSGAQKISSQEPQQQYVQVPQQQYLHNPYVQHTSPAEKPSEPQYITIPQSHYNELFLNPVRNQLYRELQRGSAPQPGLYQQQYESYVSTARPLPQSTEQPLHAPQNYETVQHAQAHTPQNYETISNTQQHTPQSYQTVQHTEPHTPQNYEAVQHVEPNNPQNYQGVQPSQSKIPQNYQTVQHTLLPESLIYRYPEQPNQQDVVHILPQQRYTPAPVDYRQPSLPHNANPAHAGPQVTVTPKSLIDPDQRLQAIGPEILNENPRDTQAYPRSLNQKSNGPFAPQPTLQSPEAFQSLSTLHPPAYSTPSTPQSDYHASPNHFVQIQQQELQEVHSNLGSRPLGQSQQHPNELDPSGHEHYVSTTPREHQPSSTPQPSESTKPDYEIEISSNVDHSQLPKDLRPIKNELEVTQHQVEITTPQNTQHESKQTQPHLEHNQSPVEHTHIVATSTPHPQIENTEPKTEKSHQESHPHQDSHHHPESHPHPEPHPHPESHPHPEFHHQQEQNKPQEYQYQQLNQANTPHQVPSPSDINIPPPPPFNPNTPYLNPLLTPVHPILRPQIYSNGQGFAVQPQFQESYHAPTLPPLQYFGKFAESLFRGFQQ